MVEPEVAIQAGWDYDDSGAKALIADIDSVSSKTEEGHYKMDRSSVRLARSTAHLGMMFGNLYGMIERTASGQLDIVRSLPMLISYFVSLATTIYTVVAAEKTRMLATGLANAISSSGMLVPAMIAGAAAIAAAVGAYVISTRQAGGPIYRSGYYKLEAGEVYKRGFGGGGVQIVITGNSITSETLPVIGRKLITELEASGVI